MDNFIQITVFSPPKPRCLCLQECGKGLQILCHKVDVSGPLLRRQPCGYSRKRPFWVVTYGEVRGAVPDADLKIKGGGGGGAGLVIKTLR